MIKINQEKPQAANQEPFLISSESLPSFDEIEREYQEHMAAIEKDEIPAKPVRTRGRRKTEDTPAPEEESGAEASTDEITPDQIETMVCFPVDAWLISKDKKPLSNIEKKAFAISCSRLANKWLPTITSQWKEEIGFAICIGTIIFSRFEFKKAEEKKNEEIKAERESSAVG